MNNLLSSFLQTNENRSKFVSDNKKHALPYIDKTLKNVAGFIKSGYIQNDTASKKGLLQQLNARVKVIFLLCFIVIISLRSQILPQLFITVFLLTLYILSKILLAEVYKKILIFSFFFGFLVVAPASLNIITDGKIIFTIIRFNSSHQYWIYHLPAIIGITREGLFVVARFFLKVTNSLALTLLILYTTPFNEIIKSLKMLRVPDLFLMVIILTYKFIFILSQTTEEIYFALKSRWWKNLKEADASKLVAGRIAFLFRKSWIKYEETYRAMIARGFSGNVNIGYLKKTGYPDYAFLFIFLSLGIFCFFI
jgi:cobalt ECF transporter T component CbiQ